MTIAIDFETDLISDSSPIPAPVCVSWANADGDSGLVVGMDEMGKFLCRIFKNERRIIAHNLKFELLVIYKYFPELRAQLWDFLEIPGKFYCTLLYEILLSNISRKESKALGLAALVQKYEGADISGTKKGDDAWRLRYSELRDIPLDQWPEAAVSYAVDDSIYAMKVYLKQRDVNNQLKVHEHIKADFALNLMASTGMVIDQFRVNVLENELRAQVADDLAYLKESGFIGPKNNKLMGKFRSHILATVTNIRFTKTDQVSTKKENLYRYLAESPDDKVISGFINVLAREKIQSAFVKRLKTASPLIRTDYNAIVRTGRTSARASDAYPSVNIQQMPREVPDVTYDIRACFKPREGFEIVSIDYSGLELTATANQLTRVFGRSRMADVLNGGDTPTDMHSRLAAKIMSIKQKRDVSYEEFMQNKKKDEYKFYRQLAKPINLGFPGGIGYTTMRGLLAKDGIFTKYEILERGDSERNMQNIAYHLKFKYPNLRVERTGIREWSLVYDELVGFKKALFALYPELEKFLKEHHAHYQTGDFMATKNDWGQWETERAYEFDTSGVRRGFCTYTALCNGYLMQTPAAVGAKEATYQVVKKYFEDENLNPLAFIHDEIIFEVRADDPNKFEKIDDVADIMVSSMQKALPHVRIAVEASLMDWWSKSGGKWEAQYWKDAKSNVLHKKEI